MRTGSVQARLLALTIAVAIAVPAYLPSWPGDAEARATPPPAARATGGSPGKAALSRVAPHTSWHGAGFACADPSDEPDEGSDGWVPAHGVGLPASDAAPRPVADGRRVAGAAPARAKLSPGALCRLRC